MSSTTVAGGSATTATAAASTRQTYWCHECDMSVSLLTTSAPPPRTPLLCPYCHSDFLEEMDFFAPNPNPNPNPNPDHFSPFSPSFLDSSDATPLSDITANPSDDNYLLDSPYLHRLIHHLSNSDPDDSAIAAVRRQSPASKSAVEAIPAVKITPALLELDPVILCAVCKDQFVVGVETKQLPCKHMYHSDCILPWLSQHNSCPVCRFQLPIEEDSKEKRKSRVGDLRFGELMEDEGLFGFGNTLRHIARRHRLVLPASQQSGLDSFLLSPTQVAEAGPLTVERANSVETVSSWPSWPVEGGVGGGDGEFGSSARVTGDGDTVMSEARVSGSVSSNLRYSMNDHAVIFNS